uniref:Uncharacterized protein n=1 Tax=Arundo donax TaxID=35708 RepID=A0A0A9FMY5_ARUDO
MYVVCGKNHNIEIIVLPRDKLLNTLHILPPLYSPFHCCIFNVFISY